MGPNIPGTTYMKSMRKVFQEKWYVKSRTVQMEVVINRSGAKYGHGKYLSRSKAPVKLVDITE